MPNWGSESLDYSSDSIWGWGELQDMPMQETAVDGKVD